MFLNVLEKSKIFQQINKKKNGTCMGKGINSKKDTRLSGENFKEAIRKKSPTIISHSFGTNVKQYVSVMKQKI